MMPHAQQVTWRGVMKALCQAVMSETSDNSSIGGTQRATKRPDHVKPPEGWSNDPLPKPVEPIIEKGEDQPGGRNPVRYGDWELKGIAVDF
jgi:hypothetical protein